jgi:MFS family permease
MGLVYGGFFIGFIVAAPLAGVVGAAVSLRAVVALAAAFFLASTSLAFLIGPGRAEHVITAGRLPRSFWVLLSLTPFAAFVAVLPTPLLPVYFREVAGLPLTLVGVFVAFVSLGSALFSTLGGRTADTFGPVAAVVANASILAVGACVVALGAGTAPLLAVGAILLGANVGSNPVLAATLERILPPARRALGYCAFQLVYGVGFGAGGIAAGALYDADPFLPLLVTAAVAVPVGALVSLVVVRIVRGADAAAEPLSGTASGIQRGL